MGKSLIIAEKPSVAGDIARALGGFKKEHDFFESDSQVVSSAVGHLVELAAPEGIEPKRGKWNLENLPVLPEEFDLRPIEKNEARFKLLKRLLKRADVDEIINACDAGREGELIFRNLVKLAGVKKPVRRLWLQSMTAQSIRDAFQHLRTDAEMQPLAAAAVSRSESDWLVGINSTRALTAFNSRHVGGFQKTTAGRVQTPTLAILVEREEKIRAFKPRTYWEVFADFAVAAGSYRGRWFDPAFKKGAEEDARAERIWTRERAEEIRAKCLGKPASVEEEKKPQTQISPQLYDLTTLQREANSRFGLPANRTLQIAQALYERHKVLTYPRTDSRYLPEDYIATSKDVLGGFADPTLARHAAKALQNGWVHPNKRIFNNAKVSDHFAIVPTGAHAELDEMQAKIYDMVARRFIAVFFPPAEFELTTRITTVEQEKFKTDGKIVIKPGWLEVYGREAQGEDASLVPVAAGEEARTEATEIKESDTKPAARFTEATLLSAMEGAGKLIDDEELRDAMSEKGLGTPATRAATIEGLIFEGYVERKGRDLIATAKGISLITLLRNVKAETLTKPEMTGEWEFKLRQMERGQLSRDDFMLQIRGLTREIVDKVKGFGEKPIEGEFATLEIPCPVCGAGPFKEDYRTYTCAGCGLRIWKSMAGREFEPEEVKELLTKGRVGPLEGFRSKMGRAFAAAVKLGKDGKPEFEFENSNGGGGSEEPVDLSTLTPLAPCPVCQAGNVYELDKAYACENNLRTAPGKKPCVLRIAKTILQKQIPPEQMKKLLTEGKTDLLAGFVSKKGRARPFSAFLTLNAKGKIGWEFPPREAKGKRPPPPPAKAA